MTCPKCKRTILCGEVVAQVGSSSVGHAICPITALEPPPTDDGAEMNCEVCKQPIQLGTVVCSYAAGFVHYNCHPMLTAIVEPPTDPMRQAWDDADAELAKMPRWKQMMLYYLANRKHGISLSGMPEDIEREWRREQKVN